MKLNTLGSFLAFTAIVALSVTSFAASPRRSGKIQIHEKVVGLFEGMESGDLHVRLITKNAAKGKVIIENKTKLPITIKLPATFAGVPVDAQFGGGGMGGGGMGGGMGGGGMGGGGMGGMGGGGGQGVGGGMGGGGMGGMGGGGMGGGGMGGGMGGGGMGGGGLFNVDPEKVRRIDVTTVCLQHGKPEPNAKMEYKIIPLTLVTNNYQIMELCRMVGTGEVPQNSGQAAAWHLTDGLSWQELAHKDRFYSQLTGARQKYFNGRELQLAYRIVAEAGVRGKRLQKLDSLRKQASPGDKQNELLKTSD